MLFSFKWEGKLISINRYLKARAIKVNNKWTASMYASKEYHDLILSLMGSISYYRVIHYKELINHTITDKINMIIKICRSNGSDTGNIEKPISDALEKSCIIKNDNLIKNLFIFRDYHKKKAGIMDALEVQLYAEDDKSIVNEIKKITVDNPDEYIFLN